MASLAFSSRELNFGPSGLFDTDKWFGFLYVCVDEDFEVLLEKALPEHILLFRRLIRGCGLSWDDACRCLRENGR
ncbi:MAG: hypothetical protein V1921_05170 [Candidatus Altiarchaeota archaeon]